MPELSQTDRDVAGQYADMERVFRELFYLTISEYHTCLPCTVVAVNASTQTVDIQPTLKKYYIGTKQSVNRALIKNVPFWVFRAGDTYISLPIKVGDTGLAIFCMRDITNWKQTGGTVPLQSTRIMDYNDAVFIPYVGAKAQAISDYNPDFIEIVKNGKKITVQDGILNAPEYHIECKSIHASQTIDADGLIKSLVDCISGLISGATHVHSGVQSGTSTTGGPQ